MRSLARRGQHRLLAPLGGELRRSSQTGCLVTMGRLRRAARRLAEVDLLVDDRSRWLSPDLVAVVTAEVQLSVNHGPRTLLGTDGDQIVHGSELIHVRYGESLRHQNIIL